MVHRSNIAAKLNIFWHRFRKLMLPYANFDYHHWLELILIVGGIRPLPGDEPWKRYLLALYKLLGLYQFIIGVAKVGCSLLGNNLIEFSSSVMILFCLTSISVKLIILENYKGVIQQINQHFDSECTGSGDPDFDAAIRRRHPRLMGKIIVAIFLVLFCEQAMLMVPSSARERIFGMPEQFDVLGVVTVRLMQETFMLMIPLCWGCRYLCISLVIIPCLMGLNNELVIVANGYATVENRARHHFHDLNFTDMATLKQILGVVVKQHVDLLRMLHRVQPLVSDVYVITYYSVMIIAPLFVFLVIRNGFTLVSLSVFVSTSMTIFECYLWCRIIGSIEETMADIAGCVATLGTRLHHSKIYHFEYIQLRTVLMIVQLNASQSGWFNCAGLFPISMESIGSLCMTIYKIATFLLDFT